MPRKAKAKAKAKAESFDVEKIVGKRYEGGRNEYRVRWKGFAEDDDTWEPVANLGGADGAIEEYEQSLARDGAAKWPYAAARRGVDDPTRRDERLREGQSELQESPQRNGERITGKREMKWRSGRTLRFEYQVVWVGDDGSPQEEWVVESEIAKCAHRAPRRAGRRSC